MRKPHFSRIFIFVLMSLSLGALTSCLSGRGREYPASAGAVDEAFKSDLTSLLGKRIYFGHQSVGKNIMEGFTQLDRESGVPGFTIINLDSSRVQEGKGELLHARIGENTHPTGKCDAFVKFLRETAVQDSTRADFDLAVLKFCYVDIKAGTDVDALLAYYKATLDSVKAKRPSLVFLHVTVPLKASAQGKKAALMRLVGRADANDPDNDRRCEYNEKLKKAFAGEPFFDLAAVESTYPDGARESFQAKGKTGYRLISSLSSDGAHLNNLGKRVAAKAFAHAMAAALHAH